MIRVWDEAYLFSSQWGRYELISMARSGCSWDVRCRTPTSKYVQGVEVPQDYSGEVPDGFDIIDLPPCKLMVFQGEPYAEEKFGEAIAEIWDVMKKFNPEIYGFEWADEDSPRIQLEPQGYRGYIEARPLRPINR